MAIPHFSPSPESSGERTSTIERTLVFTRDQVPNSPELNRLYDGFLLLREQYVREMGWLEQSDDTDRYDEDPDTKYIIRTDAQGEVSAGLRLTQVPNIGSSLSMDMWAGPIERGEEDTLAGFRKFDSVLATLDAMSAEGQSQLWDLTRLVTKVGLPSYQGDLRDRHAAYRNLMRMFGAALAATGQEATWIYTASEQMQLFLRHAGISNIEVAKDYISEGDATRSAFCLTDCAQAYAELPHLNPRGGALVKEGYDERLLC